VSYPQGKSGTEKILKKSLDNKRQQNHGVFAWCRNLHHHQIRARRDGPSHITEIAGPITGRTSETPALEAVFYCLTIQAPQFPAAPHVQN
jgi:hypothetical protein